MKKAIRAPKLVTLLGLVLGVIALGATAAHAEGTAWKIEGKTVTSALKAQIQVTELEKLESTGTKELIISTKVGLSKVEILCTEAKYIDVLLTEAGGTTGKSHLAGCVTKLSGKTAAACNPHSPGAAEELIETNIVTGLIVLHKLEGGAIDELLELLPPVIFENEKKEKVFAPFLTLLMGPEVKSECSIGAKFEITGQVFLKAGTTTEGKEETKEKLFSEGPLTKLLFGGNATTIIGSRKVTLTAPHTGMKWSGLAG